METLVLWKSSRFQAKMLHRGDVSISLVLIGSLDPALENEAGAKQKESGARVYLTQGPSTPVTGKMHQSAAIVCQAPV